MGLYWFIYQNELITDSPIMLKLYEKDNFWLITINEIPKEAENKSACNANFFLTSRGCGSRRDRRVCETQGPIQDFEGRGG